MEEKKASRMGTSHWKHESQGSQLRFSILEEEEDKEVGGRGSGAWVSEDVKGRREGGRSDLYMASQEDPEEEELKEDYDDEEGEENMQEMFEEMLLKRIAEGEEEVKEGS